MQTGKNWLGENLREARRNKKVTVQRLSDDSGVSLATIKNTESGKSIPGADIVYYLAMALGCSVSTLYGEQDKDTRAFLLSLRTQIDNFLAA